MVLMFFPQGSSKTPSKMNMASSFLKNHSFDRSLRYLLYMQNPSGKVINVQRLNKVLDTLNGWYMERGLFAQVRMLITNLVCIFGMSMP